jgi:hypothetical protein
MKAITIQAIIRTLAMRGRFRAVRFGVEFSRQRTRLQLFIAILIAFVTLARSSLPAQPARSLSLPPSITMVGSDDHDCHDTVVQLQRLIREFAFVRGHRIYVVCDKSSWQGVLHHLTLGYGVIVTSRAAISDIRLRETWFYAEALRKGVDGHKGEYLYAHELGHFACSCIDEDVADKAALELLNDAHKHRFSGASDGASK